MVARRDFAALRRICGVDDADIADMVAEIRRLNPKPGLAFGSTLVQPVVPDVYVLYDYMDWGGWDAPCNTASASAGRDVCTRTGIRLARK